MDDSYQAVMEARRQLLEWLDEGRINFEHSRNWLADLLNSDNIRHMRVLTIEELRMCKLLCGPHGWAVYKMLEARRGE